MITFVGLTGCVDSLQTPEDQTTPPEAEVLQAQQGPLTEQQIVNLDVDLSRFGKSIAKMLKNPQMLQLVSEKVALEFDGDFDVLWDQLQEATQKAGKTEASFGNMVIAGMEAEGDVTFASSDCSTIDCAIRAIESQMGMKVQLYWHNFDQWNGTDLPVLAAPSITQFKEETGDNIVAWKLNGEQIVVDEAYAATHPVVVLSFNERTNLDGSMHADPILNAPGDGFGDGNPGDDDCELQLDGCGGSSGGGGNTGGGDDELLPPNHSYSFNQVYLKWDSPSEPWIKGKPEFRAKTIGFGGQFGAVQMGSVSWDGQILRGACNYHAKYYFSPHRLGYWQIMEGNPIEIINVQYYEADGGATYSVNFGATIAGISYTFSATFKDDDDMLDMHTLYRDQLIPIGETVEFDTRMPGAQYRVVR